MTSLLFVVPCLNEEKSVSKVISEIQLNFPSNPICVVNDGSTDRTGEVAREYLGKDDLLLEFPTNLGIARAVREAASAAANRNISSIMQVDGDGQHPMESIKLVLEKTEQLIRKGESDFVVIGSRYNIVGREHGSTTLRIMGNQTLRVLLQVLYPKLRVSDPTSGLRVFHGKALQLIVSQYPNKWPEPIFIGKLYRNGISIYEVPVDMKSRSNGKSSISGIKSIYFMLYTISSILSDRFK